MFFWLKNRRGQLSAYIDGELSPSQQMRIGEQLAFDADLRLQLAELEHAKAIVVDALSPVPAVDSAYFVANLFTAIPPEIPSRKTRRHLAPAAIAAAGILVTAGITFARLRRRGIV